MSKKKNNTLVNNSLDTCIGKRGYTVLKEQLTSTQIQKIRKDLTVQAYVNQDYGAKPSPFPVYCESTRKLYLPRYYGLNNFGPPKINKLDFGEEINNTSEPHNGRTMLIGNCQGQFIRKNIMIQPNVGDFYIFPYDVEHLVYPFSGDGLRRTMSLNYDVNMMAKTKSTKHLNNDNI